MILRKKRSWPIQQGTFPCFGAIARGIAKDLTKVCGYKIRFVDDFNTIKDSRRGRGFMFHGSEWGYLYHSDEQFLQIVFYGQSMNVYSYDRHDNLIVEKGHAQSLFERVGKPELAAKLLVKYKLLGIIEHGEFA